MNAPVPITDSLSVGGGKPLLLIAGPCVIESEAHCLALSEKIKTVADEHGFRHHHHRLAIYGVCHECQDNAAVILEASSGGRGVKHQ